MNDDNLEDTIIPKSDQLNADDFLSGMKVATVTAVKRSEGDQPIAVWLKEYDRPYKPCKSMRRVLITAWGKTGSDWVGKRLALFNDPDVMWGGVKVGGIRIARVSHIDAEMVISLTATKGKRKQFILKKLEDAPQSASTAPYPDEKFQADLPKMLASIASGKTTVEKIIAFCEKTGKLTDAQKAQLSPALADDNQNEFL